ncbi:hypothetical protein [Mycoplasma parvum]|uniref:Uncharacterized protein n=1 Tax=Mycoplasma parvum str. Indiana TaxID=1403316 RepID=U5NFN7_9MOLU|nr:hypothetical protein [Mycoplasma parvum]AGX88974.1 hypothetical protein PRV_01050 [Mycoplasma parvum str. Indiana]
MKGKLISSFLGLGGIFGFSIKSHLTNWNIENLGQILKKPLISSLDKKFAMQQISQDRLKEQKNYDSNSSSLNKNLFQSWKYQSEGGYKDVYLVDYENRIKKISPENHGHKRRRMNDGILIDRLNKWFGYRSLTHQIFSGMEKHNKEELSNLDKVNTLKLIIKKISQEEMRLLGEWWDKLQENQKCEILDIFIDCENTKKFIGNKSTTPLSDSLKIKPEELVKTFRKDGKNFPLFREIIGSGKFIDFPFKREIGLLGGGPINEWIEEFVTDKYIENEKRGGVNLISTAIKLLTGTESFKKCSDVASEDKKFFPECGGKLNPSTSYETIDLREQLIIPELKNVVKGGMKSEENAIRVSTRSIENQKSSIKQWVNEAEEKNSEKSKNYIDVWKKKGIKDGIIDIKCSQWGWYWWEKLLNGLGGKQQGCEFAWSLIFPQDVDDKRWCLYEIPNAKSYVREYHIKFLSFSNWFNSNKFWGSCLSYEL